MQNAKSEKMHMYQSIVNIASYICSNKELLSEKIRTIKTIAKTAGFKNCIGHKLYRKRTK